MKKNKKAFSLVIAIWLVLISSLLALTIYEYIFPFSRSVVWMENSAKAYYYANSWIEDALLKLSEEEKKVDWKIFQNDLWQSFLNENFASVSSILALSRGFVYNIDNIWTVEPEAWKWNSNTDLNYNQISVWNPIQINLKSKSLNPTSLSIQIKIPTINKIKHILEWWNNSFVSFQLSSALWYLNFDSNSTTKFFDKTALNKPNWATYKLSEFKWNLYLNSNPVEQKNVNFSTAFSQLGCSVQNCILKFSVINKLEAKASGSAVSKKIFLPYLEWKIDWKWIWWTFRKRYTDITSNWKSNAYSRELNIKVPQTTVNEAFDFTVFQ